MVIFDQIEVGMSARIQEQKITPREQAFLQLINHPAYRHEPRREYQLSTLIDETDIIQTKDVFYILCPTEKKNEFIVFFIDKKIEINEASRKLIGPHQDGNKNVSREKLFDMGIRSHTFYIEEDGSLYVMQYNKLRPGPFSPNLEDYLNHLKKINYKPLDHSSIPAAFYHPVAQIKESTMRIIMKVNGKYHEDEQHPIHRLTGSSY
jgi:hypothetical protein